MSGVAPISAAHVSSTGNPSAGATRATHAPPGPPVLAAGMDFTAALYAVHTENRDGQQRQARVGVESAQHERDAQLEASRKAIRQAEAEAAQAAEEGRKSGFFGRIASVLSLPATALLGVYGGMGTIAVMIVGGLVSSSASNAIRSSCGNFLGSVAQYGGAALMGGGVVAQLELDVARHGSVYVAAGTTGIVTGWLATSTAATNHQHAQKDAEANAVENRADAAGMRANAEAAQSEVTEIAGRVRALEASVRRAIGSVLAAGADLERTRAMVISNTGRSVA